jgi:hypothetical protein
MKPVSFWPKGRTKQNGKLFMAQVLRQTSRQDPQEAIFTSQAKIYTKSLGSNRLNRCEVVYAEGSGGDSLL